MRCSIDWSASAGPGWRWRPTPAAWAQACSCFPLVDIPAMHGPDDGDDLFRVLAALQRAQGTWLEEVESVLPGPGVEGGDPAFAPAFRRWGEHLAMIRLQLHRVEGRLLNFVLSGPPGIETSPVRIDGRPIHRQWRERLSAWFHTLHLDTTYRYLESVRDLDGEPVNADVVTDLATLLEVVGVTHPLLLRIAEDRNPATVQDMAFFHVVSPWRRTGRGALSQVQRWLDEVVDQDGDW